MNSEHFDIGFSNLDSPAVSMLVIAVLIKRLGGEVTITDGDVAEISFAIIHEMCTDNVMNLKLIQNGEKYDS